MASYFVVELTSDHVDFLDYIHFFPWSAEIDEYISTAELESTLSSMFMAEYISLADIQDVITSSDVMLYNNIAEVADKTETVDVQVVPVYTVDVLQYNTTMEI